MSFHIIVRESEGYIVQLETGAKMAYLVFA